MKEDKVEEVLKWPTPQCERDFRKFLGLANYYRRFVKDFAKVALPIYHSYARTSSSVLYSLPLHQKGNINKATW